MSISIRLEFLSLQVMLYIIFYVTKCLLEMLSHRAFLLRHSIPVARIVGVLRSHNIRSLSDIINAKEVNTKIDVLLLHLI